MNISYTLLKIIFDYLPWTNISICLCAFIMKILNTYKITKLLFYKIIYFYQNLSYSLSFKYTKQIVK